MSEKKLVQVQFIKVVRIGTSGSQFEYLTGEGSILPATRVEEHPVELSLTDNELFVRVKVRGGKVVHLIPMSNVTTLILEAAR